jgi:tetratricopeptide (TPR) repeat protein
MRIARFILIVSLFFGTVGVPIVSFARPKRGNTSSQPRLIAGLGIAHHPVSTKNVRAQEFFDQGLALIYGFNHEEARKSFQHAAELDPKLAMAWWGIALAVGPNYNFPVEPEHAKAGYEAVQRAIALQEGASESERGYINALSYRYSNNPKADTHQLEVAYREAMARLVRRYPDDLDAATLYADAMMNLHPWKLWSRDGRPNADTEEIVAVLESVLRQDPNHLGANHLYIHAVEASPHPERGLVSAARLGKLAPAADHLVHMSSHIYARVGDYIAAARANQDAVAIARKPAGAPNPLGMQWVMLDLHNLHFLTYAHCMNGDLIEAKRAAEKLTAQARPRVKQMPMLEGFLPTPMFVLVAFERWKDILRLPAPDPSLIYTTAQWHFARAMAFAGSKQKTQAQQESKMFFADLAKLPPDAAFDPLNSLSDITRVQENLLASAIMRSESEEEEREEIEAGEAVEALQHAIAAEDNLNYTEPPSWYPPVRPVLGQLLLERGDAVAAEKVFRSALQKTPRYSRALAGLRDSLKAQRRDYEALLVEQQLREGKPGAASPPHRHRR